VIQSKKPRKKFDKAFKQHAVELWLNSGKVATEVAAELGIHAQRLSAWRKHSSFWGGEGEECAAVPLTNLSVLSGCISMAMFHMCKNLTKLIFYERI